MSAAIPPSLIPAQEKIDEMFRATVPELTCDDDQKKGRMYKLGSRRLCGVRVRLGHLSLHLYGLPIAEPDPTGLLVARTRSHLRAEVRNYEEARRMQPLLDRVYAVACLSRS